ncbi:MAG: beta-galactosidase [Planctomycetota bacterium]|nr:MAG: beta-galactosidase [Planctomycetota bacterium]
MRSVMICLALFSAIIANVGAAEGEWKPAKGRLMTRWAKDVSPEKVLPEYPRPQMVRKEWTNLNGLWQYAVRPVEQTKPDTKWDGQILVPFAIESALSGVMKTVKSDERLWYRRTFERPKMQKDGRLLLHFGAVDWEATVYVNGKEVGSHRGGYTPFSFDVTDALKADGEQEIVVAVWDPTDKSTQPRGKQIGNPHGIWYTAVTGIWQTVWLEPVPKTYIESLKIVPDLEKKQIAVTVRIAGEPVKDWSLRVEANGISVDQVSGHASIEALPPQVESDGPDIAQLNDEKTKVATVAFEADRVWSPDDPALYSIDVKITQKVGPVLEGKTLDDLDTYAAQRKIEFRKDDAGHNRLFLNNKPLFQYGPLDQGWWPDGLYTAPTDEALAYDIEVTKKLGMNMCRKHVKVEPARWYYHCDRLGLLVWQDMPSGDRYIAPNQPDIERSADSEANYRREWQAIVDYCRNFPSVVAWVPFNEGWGQFKTNEILEWTKKHDPTRLVDGPSGWSDRGGGDMHDMHMYPGPGMFPVSDSRASVLGEFGGLGLPLKGHLWQDRDNWGYRTYQSREELQSQYERLIRKLRPLIGQGLAAAVYTQTTDVEGEVNGLMTYDREIVKLDAERMAELHKKLYGPQPKIEIKTVVATSEREPQTWKYTTTKPAEGWEKPDFDASKWQEGPAGFGALNPPGSRVRTNWNTKDIWIRRTFKLFEGAAKSRLQFRIHHDENAEIYLNGVLSGKTEGYTTEYIELELDAKGREALKQGENTIAVHCRQTGGGQYIDVGLVEVIVTEPAAK